MRLLEAFGVVVLAALLLLVGLYLRRLLITSGAGSIELSVRVSNRLPGRGWALGVGRFSGERLKWFRIFSFGMRPRCVFARSGLAVMHRRLPTESESLALLTDSVVLECTLGDQPVQLAMTEAALTGFLSWLEAAPPGVTLPPYAAR
jgi:hypothetical protein